jgi:transcriptional regulator with XRE-family HTH domain
VKPKSPQHVALGSAIRELRNNAGISQEYLADRSDMHRTYVGGIERGERNASFGNLLKLADALDVRLSVVVARSEDLLAASDPESSP